MIQCNKMLWCRTLCMYPKTTHTLKSFQRSISICRKGVPPSNCLILHIHYNRAMLLVLNACEVPLLLIFNFTHRFLRSIHAGAPVLCIITELDLICFNPIKSADRCAQTDTTSSKKSNK